MSNLMKPPFKFRPGLLVCSLALAPFAHAGAPRDSLAVSRVLVEHCQTRTDPDARPMDFGVPGFACAHTTVPSGRAGEAMAIRCSFGRYPSVTLTVVAQLTF
ncbi:hypothetical protein ARC78_11000 [Stenotrophomonas pictorum JCM 9942]|uniref:Secreted protein n=2 Tax=Stenotrophomonas pictorum TaxID=86184 RepID=A0A0R0A9B9_9GAMM|nr:hypothetical protein ARC78_11000 [Stenotrophomonas pictorum JCM 9942]